MVNKQPARPKLAIIAIVISREAIQMQEHEAQRLSRTTLVLRNFVCYRLSVMHENQRSNVCKRLTWLRAWLFIEFLENSATNYAHTWQLLQQSCGNCFQPCRCIITIVHNRITNVSDSWRMSNGIIELWKLFVNRAQISC